MRQSNGGCDLPVRPNLQQGTDPMPQADTASIISRRNLLGVGTASLAASAMHGYGQAKSASELRLLCQSYHRIRKILGDMEVEKFPVYGSKEEMIRNERMISLIEQERYLLDQISLTHADNFQGVLEKSQVIETYLVSYCDVFEADSDSPQIRVVLSLLHDIASISTRSLS